MVQPQQASSEAIKHHRAEVAKMVLKLHKAPHTLSMVSSKSCLL